MKATIETLAHETNVFIQQNGHRGNYIIKTLPAQWNADSKISRSKKKAELKTGFHHYKVVFSDMHQCCVKISYVRTIRTSQILQYSQLTSTTNFRGQFSSSAG